MADSHKQIMESLLRLSECEKVTELFSILQKKFLGRKLSVQRFTAIGEITDEEPYRSSMGNGFHPFRRNVNFMPCTEVSILPLIVNLTFIKNKIHWGAQLRFGVVEIHEQDFQLIRGLMLEK